MHLDIGFPPDVEPITGSSTGLALSPDGRAVAMVGVRTACACCSFAGSIARRRVEVAGTGGVNSAAFVARRRQRGVHFQ